MANLVNVGVSHLTAAELADKLEGVAHAMQGNANFPAPPFPPQDLVDASGAIRAALKEKDDLDAKAKLATAKLHAAINKGREKGTAYGHYVAATSNGDETKIKSAMMELKAKAVHSQSIATPTGVSAALGDHPHEVQVHWHGRASKHGGGNAVHEFHVETTVDPSKVDSWTLAGSSTTSKLLVENLPTGAHSFRLIAIGTDHVSPPSGVVTIYVP